MRAVNKHPRARRDLIDIWFYTLDHWDEQQADRYLRQIDEAIQRLAENPRLGADCSEIRAGYRRVAAGQHRVYYRLEAMSSRSSACFMSVVMQAPNSTIEPCAAAATRLTARPQ